MSSPLRILMVFLDGVGVGPPDPVRNPFLRAEMPRLRSLLSGPPPTLDEPLRTNGLGVAFPVDALLGVPGLPQSGTGQTALLTGENAAAAFGRHFGPWTPVSLRPLLESRNVLRRALDAGYGAAFANAYPRWQAGAPPRRAAAPPLAAFAAGLLVRHEGALARGDAVASEIVNDGWRKDLGFTDLPVIGAEQAGLNLARIANDQRLTLFAHYSTDHAGHRGGMAGAVQALERVDAFLGGVVDGLAGDALLLVTSDHGNIEDVTAGHNQNPALGLLYGPGAQERRKELASLLDVTPALLRWLDEG